MAKEGKTVDDIVKYYYQGTQISEADAFLNKYMAKVEKDAHWASFSVPEYLLSKSS